MTAPAGRLLQVTAVSHAYGSGARRVQVLHEVDLCVEAGELVALTGPSGSGKSTLCHLVAGFETPHHGEVLVEGRPAAQVADWSVLSVVPQQLGLIAGLTAAENVRLPALRAGRDIDDRLAALAVDLHIAELLDREVTEASLGEQQRVAVARSLVLTPRLVVLDEPTGHQDDERVETVLAVLRAAAGDGGVLVASHDPRVWHRADRVVGLDEGRLA